MSPAPAFGSDRLGSAGGGGLLGSAADGLLAGFTGSLSRANDGFPRTGPGFASSFGPGFASLFGASTFMSGRLSDARGAGGGGLAVTSTSASASSSTSGTVGIGGISGPALGRCGTATATGGSSTMIASKRSAGSRGISSSRSGPPGRVSVGRPGELPGFAPLSSF